MYYSKHPFLKVGLPFLTAMITGTFFLVDLRKSRYENVNFSRKEAVEVETGKERRTLKSLEEELKEWEEQHKRKLKERND